MSQSKKELKLLLSNQAGYDALLAYLEELHADLDNSLTSTARMVLFASDQRDAAIALHGKVQVIGDLIDLLKSISKREN